MKGKKLSLKTKQEREKILEQKKYQRKLRQEKNRQKERISKEKKQLKRIQRQNFCSDMMEKFKQDLEQKVLLANFSSYWGIDTIEQQIIIDKRKAKQLGLKKAFKGSFLYISKKFALYLKIDQKYYALTTEL